MTDYPNDDSECAETPYLAECPHLAPALEPGIRVLDARLAVVVDQSRVDQLRCGGNGVVALQAARAFVELAGRLVR